MKSKIIFVNADVLDKMGLGMGSMYIIKRKKIGQKTLDK